MEVGPATDLRHFRHQGVGLVGIPGLVCDLLRAVGHRQPPLFEGFSYRLDGVEYATALLDIPASYRYPDVGRLTFQAVGFSIDNALQLVARKALVKLDTVFATHLRDVRGTPFRSLPRYLPDEETVRYLCKDPLGASLPPSEKKLGLYTVELDQLLTTTSEMNKVFCGQLLIAERKTAFVIQHVEQLEAQMAEKDLQLKEKDAEIAQLEKQLCDLHLQAKAARASWIRSGRKLCRRVTKLERELGRRCVIQTLTRSDYCPVSQWPLHRKGRHESTSEA